MFLEPNLEPGLTVLPSKSLGVLVQYMNHHTGHVIIPASDSGDDSVARLLYTCTFTET
jgi:hypothetical protein